jgi:hypothetical protein
VSLHNVVLHLNGTGADGLIDTIPLGTVFARTRFGNSIAGDYDISGMGLDVKTISLLRLAVVQDFVLPERIAVAAVFESFLPEIYAAESVA